ncbi:unnamed protein product [Brassica rapa subsp. trilocularis]
MEICKFLTLIFLAIVVLYPVQATAQGGDPHLMSCMQKLMSCQPYIHAVNPPPPPSCCGPMKEIVVKDAPCLCAVFNDPAILKTLNLTKENALDLPKACGANPDISLCSKTASLPPTAPPGPTSVTTSCCFSSSVYFRCWRGRSNVGTVVNPARRRHDVGGLLVSGCLSSPDSSSPPSSISGPKTKLYVSGLSFRTTEDNLRNVFEQFGKLTLVNLVMDKVANRPRGFAFLRYETEEESMKAIQGMHGKFLDGRVIFVEEAKPKSDLQRAKPRSDFNKAQTKPRTFRTW